MTLHHSENQCAIITLQQQESLVEAIIVDGCIGLLA